MTGVPVATVLRDLTESRGVGLELVAGAGGVDRRITNPYPQKTGLALSGFDQYLREGRVLVLGESEIRFLESLSAAERLDVVGRVFSHDLPCIVVTAGFAPPAELTAEADRVGLPLLRSRGATPIVMARLSAALDAYLAARGVVHGVLMDILGLGVLIVGDSGIGKSECALDLVVRGHRLVADDAVELRSRAEAFLIGTCPELTRHHMEIRGLGLINVQDLFGVASTRRSKRVELVVQLERWDPAREYQSPGSRRNALRNARHQRPDDPDAGRARAQPGDSGGGRGTQPAAALRRTQLGAAAGRPARRGAGAGARAGRLRFW